MSAFAPASAAARRRAWLWRNHGRFAAPCNARLPQLLVDVSSILQSDARTGIQRVVRAIWSELHRRSGETCEVVPVYATKIHGYCYAPVDFLSRTGTPEQEPVVVRAGDKSSDLTFRRTSCRSIARSCAPGARRALRFTSSYMTCSLCSTLNGSTGAPVAISSNGFVRSPR